MEIYAHTPRQERNAESAPVRNQHRAGFSFQDNRPAAIQLQKTIQAIQSSNNYLSPIQYYTVGRDYKTSENRNYRTLIDDANVLDKKPEATTIIDDLLVHTGRVDEYERYRYNAILRGSTSKGIVRNFVNDCGFFSDYLMTRDVSALAGHGNPHIKAGSGRNNAANPDEGEAYFIKKVSRSRNSCVHHQATVIAKDGGDNITCEANAGADLTEPIFDTYGTVKPKQTFHSRFKGSYGTRGQPATTKAYEKQFTPKV